MKVYHDRDETGITTSETDVEIARAAARTATDVRALTDAIGLTEERGECEACGASARVRPLLVEHDGQPDTEFVCEACQKQKIEAQLQAMLGGGDD